MATSQLIDKNAILKSSFPKYLGIHYLTERYEWTTSQLAEWNWRANNNVLDQINKVGGSVRRFNARTLNSIEQNKINTVIYDNQQNRYVLQHFQKPQTGIVVSVPDNVSIKEPLDLDLLLNSKVPTAFTFVLNLGNNSSLKIKQYFHISGDQKNTSIIFAGKQGDDSHLKINTCVISDHSIDLAMFGEFDSGNDSQCDWSLEPNSKGNLLGDVSINLRNPGSFGNLNTLRIGSGNDQVGFQGAVKHYGENTTSRINMRGVLFDSSKINFTSIGQIIHGAAGADAEQQSRLMTVGQHTKGTVNPLLLIDENDVQAGHAASVGQYDEDDLYYLLSRGITMEQAKKILVSNFISPVFKPLDKKSQKLITNYLEGSINGGL